MGGRLMSDAMASASGGRATVVRSNLESLRAAYPAFNEIVRTEGDVSEWVAEFFDPDCAYRPIEDPEWLHDPKSMRRSLVRWIEAWGVGKYRITAEEIVELAPDRFMVAALNRGTGRGSGVPIEAMTYQAMIWRDGRCVWFDEYSDRHGAMTALEDQISASDRHEGTARDPLTRVERLWKLGEAGFLAFVRRRSDSQLERLFDSGPALRAIFKRMEQVFEPDKAGDFRGEIQYELIAPSETRRWVVRIDGDRARTRAGEATEPIVTATMALSLFVRIAARQIHAARAFREGWIEVDGDFHQAARIGVMFGLSR
jgi:SCP-2 sterol transfer family